MCVNESEDRWKNEHARSRGSDSRRGVKSNRQRKKEVKKRVQAGWR